MQMHVIRGAKNNSYQEPGATPPANSGELGMEALQADGAPSSLMPTLRKKSIEESFVVQNEAMASSKKYGDNMAAPYIDEMPSEDDNLNPLTTYKKASAPPTTTPKHPQTTWTQMSINCIMNSGAFSSDEMLNSLNERAFGLT